MSGLAKLLAESGKTITGSDIRRSSRLDALSDLGIEVWSGHRPERVADVELMVISSAVPRPDQDPEVEAARRGGVEVWRRPRLLGAMTADISTVGPTGTHGKTSSAAMLVEAARAAGESPSFAVGENIIGLGTNAGLGADPWLVLEVDEAFRTFEEVNLSGLVITNVEAEHLEHFETVDNLESTFVRVARGVEGPVLAGIDDPRRPPGGGAGPVTGIRVVCRRSMEDRRCGGGDRRSLLPVGGRWVRPEGTGALPGDPHGPQRSRGVGPVRGVGSRSRPGGGWNSRLSWRAKAL